MINLVIDKVTPSQNEWDYMPMYKRIELRNDWIWLVRKAIGRNYGNHYANGKRSMQIISYRPRKLDVQNLEGGLKQIEDILTRPKGLKNYGWGLLVDDSPKYLHRKQTIQITDTQNPRTEIIIEDI